MARYTCTIPKKSYLVGHPYYNTVSMRVHTGPEKILQFEFSLCRTRNVPKLDVSAENVPYFASVILSINKLMNEIGNNFFQCYFSIARTEDLYPILHYRNF